MVYGITLGGTAKLARLRLGASCRFPFMLKLASFFDAANVAMLSLLACRINPLMFSKAAFFLAANRAVFRVLARCINPIAMRTRPEYEYN